MYFTISNVYALLNIRGELMFRKSIKNVIYTQHGIYSYMHIKYSALVQRQV